MLADEIKQKKIKKYQRRIFFLLRSCYRFFQDSAKSVQLIDAYQKIYRPLTDYVDSVLLPFQSKGKFAIKAKKVDCFFALLNHIIEQFWQFHKDQENEAELLEALIKAEDIVKNGLENYKIIGSNEKGYCFA